MESMMGVKLGYMVMGYDASFIQNYAYIIQYNSTVVNIAQ